MNALFNVWNDHAELPIKNTQFTLKGFSIAAFRTNFMIRQLDLMLDAGIPANMNPKSIFVSHVHADHIANLPFHLYGGHNVQIYCPAPSAVKLCNYIQGSFALNDHLKDNNSKLLEEATEIEEEKEGSKDLTNSPKIIKSGSKLFTLHKVNYDQVSDLVINNQKYKVEVIRCFHSIATVGYGFTEVRSKLKAEYVGMEPKEIGALRKSGVEVTEEKLVPFLLYLGDTDKRILENKELEKYSTIMIECTFLLADELSEAKKRKHIHWDHLSSYVQNHSDIDFILYHFSQRYSKSEVTEFFAQINLPNVHAWIN
jgi:ribonuclease Z